MKKILIVDDDEDLVDIVKRILIFNEFEVHTHSSALDVPDVVKRYNPDLILLDIRLYGKSGTDICRELKRRYHLPIILFSADKIKGKDFASCEADGFLSKPFDIDDLLNIIREHLEPFKEMA